MKRILFEYRDEFCKDGKFHQLECLKESVEKCIDEYGLSECEYHILEVEEVENETTNRN